MFSGGLLSSNLTRSLGKIRNRQRSQSKKQTEKDNRNTKTKTREKQQSECYLNWDEYDTRIKVKNITDIEFIYSLSHIYTVYTT